MTVQTQESRTTHVLPFLSPLRLPVWTRRRSVWIAGALAILIVGSGALVLASAARSRSSEMPVAASPAVQVTARGLVEPVRSARVGTQNGGVVRQLQVALDATVTEQSVVAWVVGPSGTEVVTAPFAGVVTNVLVHEGDTVLPGSAIAVVADTRNLQVEIADIDQFVVSQVHVGLPVQVTIDALDEGALSGTVTAIALQPEASASGNQTYPVTISVGAMPPDARAGMSARVRLGS